MSRAEQRRAAAHTRVFALGLFVVVGVVWVVVLMGMLLVVLMVM